MNSAAESQTEPSGILWQPVTHPVFGAGVIVGWEGHTVTVRFEQFGTRTFLYPEGFEHFLTAVSPDFAAMVAGELTEACRKRKEEEALRREHLLSLNRENKSRLKERRALGANKPVPPKATASKMIRSTRAAKP